MRRPTIYVDGQGQGEPVYNTLPTGDNVQLLEIACGAGGGFGSVVVMYPGAESVPDLSPYEQGENGDPDGWGGGVDCFLVAAWK